MNKTQTQKLINKIKGYYNNQFFIDDFVLDAWFSELESYDLEDAEEHIKEYLKEYPDTPPKPHTFIRGLLTHEQKIARQNSSYLIGCNLCGKWLTNEEYERHYDRCLDIQYLIGFAKERGEKFTREDLENCRPDVIDKLLKKYPPERKEWYARLT